MPERYVLECPSPTCPNRIVEGQRVIREAWESRYLIATGDIPGEWAEPECPACDTQGVDPEDPGLLDSAEEELGRRCEHCGIVSTDWVKGDDCGPYCP